MRRIMITKKNNTHHIKNIDNHKPIRAHFRPILQVGTCWLASWLAGRLAGCQQCIWDTNMRQKTRPIARKCVKHAYP